MRKIFTLVAMTIVALGATAQSQRYGIYADTESEPGSFYGVTDLGDNVYVPGVRTDGIVGVTYTNGSATKYVLDLKKKFGSEFNHLSEFNSAALIGDAYKTPMGTYSSTWSAVDAGVLVCTGFKNTYDTTDPSYVSSDDDSGSRWPENDAEGNKINYGALALHEIAPDYWTGMTLDIPAGSALNVEKISCALAAGNNMWWSIEIFDANNNLVYDSKVAQIKNGNSTTESKQVCHVGYSADITAEGVSEPLGGEYFITGNMWGSDFATPVGGSCLPITKEKIDIWKATTGLWDPVTGDTPASKFQPLPAGGLQLTGKNTVRIYFCCKNSRILGIQYLDVYGTLTGSSGIEDITVDNAADAPLYNLAGQRVSNNYKDVVIKAGKKFVNK